MDRFKREHGIQEDLDFEVKEVPKEVLCRGVVAFLREEAFKIDSEVSPNYQDYHEGNEDEDEDNG